MNRMLGLGFLFLWILVPYAHSQPLQEKSPTISLDVTEAYLEDVLKILSKESKINFVAAEEVREKTVTTYLNEVPIQAALKTILAANRLVLKQGGEQNLFLVTESNSPKVDTFTRIFQLKYARVQPTAGEVATTFGLTGSLIKTTFSSTDGSSGTASGSSSSGGGGFGGGQGGSSGTSGGVVKIIQSLLTEHGSLVADPRTNSIIVTDIPERFPVIEETLAKVDVKPAQLFIEAEVVEVSLDTLRRIGAEYGTSTGQIASYSGPKRTSFFPFGVRAFTREGSAESTTLGTLTFADVNALLKLIATESDVKFLARPRLMTLSNEVAEIRIVSDAATGTVTTRQQDTGTTTETAERNTVGTILRVTPMVNADRYVTMVIEPEVSRVIASSTFSSFLDPTRRAARTTVMVPDGGTAMIAGLISTQDTETARRIPGLGDLPIIGLPFKRTDTERKNTEIILFITPHIMREEADETRVVMPQDREQTSLDSPKQRAIQTYRRRLTKERAIHETIENILR